MATKLESRMEDANKQKIPVKVGAAAIDIRDISISGFNLNSETLPVRDVRGS